jgi:ring-1,2-phenylacetyl-CoA epoxidase subunit PaaC
VAGPSVDASLVEFLLRVGDSTLVLGQRLGAWAGHAPIVEEDLALTNVALDLVGQARLWLAYAGECEGRGRDEDRLAFFRDAHEYRNVLLVERPNGDYGATMARQFFFDAWYLELLRALTGSRDGRISAIAQKAEREVAYHVRRSGDWVIRLGDGTETSHARMQAAVDDLWPYTGELFRSDDVDRDLANRGVACEAEALYAPWSARVTAVFDEATLTRPADGWMHTGGKSGRHSEHLSYVLAEMQSVPRSVPAEHW